MSNAAEALPDTVRVIAQAIVDSHRDAFALPRLALDEAAGPLFKRAVRDAWAVAAALDARSPAPRARGPLNAADAQALRLDLGAERLAIVAWMHTGNPTHLATAGRGNMTFAARIDAFHANLALAALFAAALPTAPTPTPPPPPPSPEPTP